MQKHLQLKDEVMQLNEQVKKVIGIFDGSLVLQSEADELEDALFVLVSDGILLMDDGFEEDVVEKNDFDPIICEEVILSQRWWGYDGKGPWAEIQCS